MNRKLGFSLGEMLVVVFILAIVGFIIFGGARGCSGQAQEQAEGEARAFCAKTGLAVTGAECMKFDSDNDGYISCTCFAQGQTPLAIECASGLFNSGCRLPKVPSVIRQSQ